MTGAITAALLALAASAAAVPVHAVAASATPASVPVADSLATAGMLPSPPEPTAGDVPLSRPIAPVPPGMSPWMVSLSVLAGIADPFFDKITPVVSVRRGFGSNLALELWGGRAFSWSGPALSLCTSAVSCSMPSASQLGATPGDLGFMGGASAVWRAAEGKVSVGGLGAHRFGLELSLGAAAVQYTFVQSRVESLVAPGVRGGIGVEGGITKSFSLRVDLQDIVYATDIRSTWSAENQLFAGLTAGWHLGVP